MSVVPLTMDRIGDTVAAYVHAVATQDRAALADLFADTAPIMGIDEGKAIAVTRDKWIEAVCSPDRSGAGGTAYSITSVSIAGTVGAVLVRTKYGRFSYDDILTLLATDAGIRVTGKTFHQYAMCDN